MRRRMTCSKWLNALAVCLSGRSLISCIIVSHLMLDSHLAHAEHYLFSAEGFHGCIDCAATSRFGICNPNGVYGSSFSSASMWNEQKLGNEFHPSSPFNSYKPGLMVSTTRRSAQAPADRSLGFFNINQGDARNSTFITGLSITGRGERVQQFSQQLALAYQEHNSDLEKVRAAFCAALQSEPTR